MTAQHISVLKEATIDLLSVKRGGYYIDGTFGRGGHSRAIAALGGNVLGIDRDDEAIKAAGEIKVVKGCHGDIKAIATRHGWNSVDGILLDLGVSSPQLDCAERGFSFMNDGPLDMRMDQTCGKSAADIVNEFGEEELSDILKELGEEREAKKIAFAIVKARARGKIMTTLALADIIEKTIGRHGAHHPATKTFQALRMYVNDEIGELKRALEDGITLLAANGRFAVITFESLTDRIVKRFFAEHVGKMVSLQQGGEKWEGNLPRAIAITKKPVVADETECNFNPRSRSAKLRVIERIS